MTKDKQSVGMGVGGKKKKTFCGFDELINFNLTVALNLAKS